MPDNKYYSRYELVSDGLDIITVAGYIPLGLPTSCLTIAPHFDTFQHVEFLRRPVEDVPGCTIHTHIYCYYISQRIFISEHLLSLRTWSLDRNDGREVGL